MTYLAKAEELGGVTSDVLTNKGIIAARKGQLSKAQKLFNDAKPKRFMPCCNTMFFVSYIDRPINHLNKNNRSRTFLKIFKVFAKVR